MQRRSFSHPTCAFSLIELSALLVVLALAMSSIISIKTSEVDRDIRVSSKSNINKVYAALNAYAGRNGRLPCVASRTLAASDANFAREVLVDCTADTSTPAGTLRYETAASSGIWVREGAVPVYDLLLPESMMFDEYGNRYSYAVIEKLTEASNYAAASGALVVKDAADADVATNAAFVVYSHGKDGKGAYRASSGALKVACGATANLDVENCDGDAIFRKADYSETQTAALFYDDLFRYGTKPVAGAGGGGGGEPPEPDFTGFRVDGAAADDNFGFSVASGDINGDGFGDVIIGAPQADNGATRTGSVYVIFGSSTGISTPINAGSLNGTNGLRIDGLVTIDEAGTHVASADIDNDGYDEIIIGAWYADNGGTNTGSTYVIFGKASGWTSTFLLSSLNGTNGFRWDGAVAYDLTARQLATGDINGDGFDDLIISAAYADFAGSSSGSTYVVFGKASGWAASASLSTINGSNGFRWDGGGVDHNSSMDLASGDINGDGYDDVIISALIISANQTGSTYVVFGKASGWAATSSLSTLNGTNGFRWDGVANNDHAIYVSSGNINGDNYDDLIIGAPNTDFASSNSGSVYVVFGKASGWAASASLSTLNGTNGFRLDEAIRGNTGINLASGNANDDSYDDIVVGSIGSNGNGAYEGSVYVVFGKASGWAANISLSTLDGTTGSKLNGHMANEQTGGSLAIGDITGDGIDDIIIGAPWADYNAVTNSGSAYGVYGKTGAWSATYNLDTLAVP